MSLRLPLPYSALLILKFRSWIFPHCRFRLYLGAASHTELAALRNLAATILTKHTLSSSSSHISFFCVHYTMILAFFTPVLVFFAVSSSGGLIFFGIFLSAALIYLQNYAGLPVPYS